MNIDSRGRKVQRFLRVELKTLLLEDSGAEVTVQAKDISHGQERTTKLDTRRLPLPALFR